MSIFNKIGIFLFKNKHNKISNYKLALIFSTSVALVITSAITCYAYYDSTIISEKSEIPTSTQLSYVAGNLSYANWHDEYEDPVTHVINPDNSRFKNDISPNLDIVVTQGYNQFHGLCRQLGLSYLGDPTSTEDLITIGFTNSSTLQCVLVGINPKASGTMNFNKIGKGPSSLGTAFEHGAGKIEYVGNVYQLIGTQILEGDFSRQDTSTRFSQNLLSYKNANTIGPNYKASQWDSLILDNENTLSNIDVNAGANKENTNTTLLSSLYNNVAATNVTINTTGSDTSAYDMRLYANNNLSTKLSNNSFSVRYENKNDQQPIDYDNIQTPNNSGINIQYSNNDTVASWREQTNNNSAIPMEEQGYTNRFKYNINNGFYRIKFDVNTQYSPYTYQVANPLTKQNISYSSSGQMPVNLRENGDSNTYLYNQAFSSVDLDSLRYLNPTTTLDNYLNNYFVRDFNVGHNNPNRQALVGINAPTTQSLVSGKLRGIWAFDKHPYKEVGGSVVSEAVNSLDNTTFGSTFNIQQLQLELNYYGYSKSRDSSDKNRGTDDNHWHAYISNSSRPYYFENIAFNNRAPGASNSSIVTNLYVRNDPVSNNDNNYTWQTQTVQYRYEYAKNGIGWTSWSYGSGNRYVNGYGQFTHWGWHAEEHHNDVPSYYWRTPGYYSSYNFSNRTKLNTDETPIIYYYDFNSKNAVIVNPFNTVTNYNSVLPSSWDIKNIPNQNMMTIDNLAVSQQNLYPIEAANIDNLILPSEYFFAVANNTFWGYKIRNLVIGGSTHFTKTRPGIMNEDATIFPRYEQIKNEADLLFVHGAPQRKRWSIDSEYAYNSNTDSLTMGIYQSKNIPFANCKIENLIILNTDTELANESFKSILQVNSINLLHANTIASEKQVSTGSSMLTNAKIIASSDNGTNHNKYQELMQNVARTPGIPGYYINNYVQYDRWGSYWTWDWHQMHHGAMDNVYYYQGSNQINWYTPYNIYNGTYNNTATTVVNLVYNNPLGYIVNYNSANDNNYQPRYNHLFTTTSAFITNDYTSDTFYRDPSVSDNNNPLSHLTGTVNFIYDKYENGRVSADQSDYVTHSTAIHAYSSSLNTKFSGQVTKIDSQTNKGLANSKNINNVADVLNSKNIYYLPWYQGSAVTTSANDVASLPKLPFNYNTSSFNLNITNFISRVKTASNINPNLALQTPIAVNQIIVPIGNVNKTNSWIDTIFNRFNVINNSCCDYLGLRNGKTIINGDSKEYFWRDIGGDSNTSLLGRKELKMEGSNAVATIPLLEYIAIPNYNEDILYVSYIDNFSSSYVSGVPNLVSIYLETTNVPNTIASNNVKVYINSYIANTLPQGIYNLVSSFTFTFLGGTRTYSCAVVISWNNNQSPIPSDSSIPQAYLDIDTTTHTLKGFKSSFNSSIYNYQYYKTLFIPDDVTKISPSAFYSSIQYSYITNIKCNVGTASGSDLLEIGNDAFRFSFPNLKSINLPRVKTIGAYAFYESTNLQDINITNFVQLNPTNNGVVYHNALSNYGMTIGDYAFANCPNIEFVFIPKLKKIGNFAFYNDNNLKYASFPDLCEWGNYPFYCSNGNSSLDDLTIGADYDTINFRWKASNYNYLLNGSLFTDGSSSSSNFVLRVPQYAYAEYITAWENLNVYSYDNYRIVDRMISYIR